MTHETDDRVIYIKDLLFVALYQWRKILVVAIVLALLGGAVLGVHGLTASFDKEAYEKELAAFESNREILNQRIELIETQILHYQDYISESPVMALDPDGFYKAHMDFTVFTDFQILPGMDYQNIDKTATIMQAYTELLFNSSVSDSLAAAGACSNKYVSDLIQINNGSTNNRVLCINVAHETQDGAQAMMDIIIDALQSSQEQIAESIGAHELTLVSSSLNLSTDGSFIQLQANTLEQLNIFQTSLDQLKLQLVGMVAPSNNAVTIGSIVKKAVLGAIIGGVLGAFAVVGIAWVIHIAGGKVYSARTLKNRTGIKVLACVPTSGQLNAFDRFLRKLEGRCTDPGSEDFAAAVVHQYCKGSSGLLVTDLSGNAIQKSLSDKLAQAGVPVCAYGNLMQSAQALSAMSTCDQVLLMVQCGKSSYTQLEQALQIIRDNNNLIGCILIDG